MSRYLPSTIFQNQATSAQLWDQRGFDITCLQGAQGPPTESSLALLQVCHWPTASGMQRTSMQAGPWSGWALPFRMKQLPHLSWILKEVNSTLPHSRNLQTGILSQNAIWTEKNMLQNEVLLCAFVSSSMKWGYRCSPLRVAVRTE